MKTLRTAFILLALGLFTASAVRALDLDFGGTLDNTTTLSVTLDPGGTAFDVDQKDKLALWIEAQLGDWISLVAQGSYTFTLDRYYLFDLDLFKANMQLRPDLSLALGRFLVSEFSGHVLSHTLDGALIKLRLPSVMVTHYAGFSGLLLKPSSTILMSGQDVADQGDDQVILASPRLIEILELVFPELFLRQDLTFSFLIQQDLRPSDQVIQEGEENQFPTGLAGGKLHTLYYGLGLSGPIVASLYYDSFFYFETGKTLSYLADSVSLTGFSYQYQPIVAFLGGIGVRFFIEKALFSRFELRGIFSSGDSDNTLFLEGNTAGNSTLFVPISRETLGLTFEPQLGNLIRVEASYSLKPFSRSRSAAMQNLQTLLKATTYLRPTLGAISEPGLLSTSISPYLGTEVDGIFNFRPFSDLGLVLSLGAFLPYGGAFTGSAAQPKLTGRFEFSFSF